MDKNWTEIIITVPVADGETAASVAQMTVPYGMYIEDYSDLEEAVEEIAHIDLIDEELVARDREHAKVHIYISPEENPAEAVSFIRERLTAEGVEHTVETQGVQEADWAFGWKKYYHPMKIGKRVVVCPTWEEYTAAEDEVVLRLDPGMAFGSGTHHTTQMCIRLLEETVFPGCKLLDMGCGSGILSLTALALGAEKAVGVDIDPLAAKISGENLALSGYVEPQFKAYHADLIKDKEIAETVGLGCYDLVAANIVADAIIALSGAIFAHLKPGGSLLSSGIIMPRLDEVTAALQAAGLEVRRRDEQGGWAAVWAVKPQ
ncbi:MAG: 50S ribosomal protein L11 methyltransferase [Oscillospiraceae bacterium]|nr:50S ribosomal protein L11 methyltransferase [Oscillospiraceae bacterium]